MKLLLLLFKRNDKKKGGDKEAAFLLVMVITRFSIFASFLQKDGFPRKAIFIFSPTKDQIIITLMSSLSAEEQKTTTPLKIFFTGGTGNNGRAIVPHLLSRGHTIKALVRDPNKATAQALEAQGCNLVKGDATSPESWSAEVADCDAVIWSSVIWGDFTADMGSLSKCCEVLADAARKEGKHPATRKLLVTTGVLGYEQREDDPQLGIPEWKPNQESFPPVKGFQMKERLVRFADICGCAISLGFTYSHSPQTSGLFPFVFKGFDRSSKKIFYKGDKSVGISHVHLEDAADMYAKIIEAPALDVKGQRFNCSNDTNVSNGEVVDAFANIWGCEAVQSETEQWALAGKTCYQDCSKAKRVLGWEPKHKSVLDELAEIIPAMYGDDPELRVTFH